MRTFRDLYGAVYILENRLAERVKVGMTTNTIGGRLEDVNSMWLGVRVSCQICGGRRLVGNSGLIPQHVVSGKPCPGGNALPLEKDVGLAESHIQYLQLQVDQLSGSDKGSAVRKINTLEKRIALYRGKGQAVGEWEFAAAYFTESAERVELLAHEILGRALDSRAPFGEVFRCSLLEAMDGIETALRQLGLLDSAKKQTRRHLGL